MASHAVAIGILKEQLALDREILKYYEHERSALEKEGAGTSNASYRHWASNKTKIYVRILNLEFTIKFLEGYIDAPPPRKVVD
jgi:hypothetical protein